MCVFVFILFLYLFVIYSVSLTKAVFKIINMLFGIVTIKRKIF